MQQNFNINWDHILFLYGFDHKNWLNIKSIYYHILSKFWINLPLMSKNLFKQDLTHRCGTNEITNGNIHSKIGWKIQVLEFFIYT